MSENYVTQIPSSEELNAEYRGIAWQDFINLTDDQVNQLLQEREAELLQKIESLPNPTALVDVNDLDSEFWITHREVRVFENFTTWKKYGIPDRNVTYDELMVRMEDSVRSLLSNDPDFGLLNNDQYSKLTEKDKAMIHNLYSYFDTMRDPFEYLVIDDYSLYETLGMQKADVESLLTNQVLQHIGESPLVANLYMLTEPFYDGWLVGKFMDELADES